MLTRDPYRRGALSMATATAAWAGLHSLMAATPAKTGFERLVGARARNGLYRPAYNATALVTFGLLIAHLRRQPYRVLYHVRGPAAAIMRVGQLGGLVYSVWGALQVGLGGLSGLPNLFHWLNRQPRVPREPEGQTPPPTAGAQAAPGSPFDLTRQALNFFLLPLLWLTPRMTTRLAAFNVVATVYLYLGSLHSERRLRQGYGAAYTQAYAGRGVPFYLPIRRG